MKRIVIIFLLPLFLYSQDINRSTLNSGGVRAAGGDYILNGSVTQQFVGQSSSGSNSLGSGFWYGLFSPQTNTIIDPDDIDADGVDNELEALAPNSGDGNADGIQDSEQITVSSIPINSQYVTLEIISSCPEMNEVDQAIIEQTEDYIFPLGAVEFKVPCSSAEVKLFFHGIEDLTGYNYRKKQADGNWFNYSNAVFGQEIIDGETVSTVTLTLTDGGPEDYDGIVNGIIHDPGGPAVLSPNSSIPIWDWWHLFVACGVLGVYFWRKS
ncbi:hypothetical protein OAQ99_03835 [Candidatus Kapabacteria bacterium]|nr:hypothetical protein [Candidatus Kapabacteria bacterium]